MSSSSSSRRFGLPGQGQLGRWRLEGELGRGAAGVVFRARDTQTGQPAAIKIYSGKSSPARLVRFRREADVLARLDHPDLVRLRDVGVDRAGRAWFAMDLVEGESLRDRLEREGPLDPEDAARLVARLARAVGHAHEHGVLHRDIKPANVLLRVDAPVLGDFGLAHELESEQKLTATGAFLGTPGYTAPEQAAGQKHELGPPADVYGLGATLYACLTGGPPYTGRTIPELLQASTRPPGPPSRVRSGLPVVLDRICAQALAPDPRRRLQTAVGLAEALEEYLEPGPAPAGRQLGAWPAFVAGMAVTGGAIGAWQLLSLEPGTPEPGTASPQPSASAPPSPAAGGRPLSGAGLELEVTAAPWREAVAELCQKLELDAALAALDAALELDPEDREARQRRAWLLYQLDRREEAEADLVLLKQSDPGDPWAAAIRGLVHSEGPFGEAERYVTEALELAPDSALVWAVQARLLGAGNGSEALEAAEKAVQLDESEPLARYALAQNLILANRQARALELLDGAIERDPAFLEAYHLRAMAHLISRNTAAGKADWDVVLQHGGPNLRRRVYAAQSDLALAGGRRDLAIAHLSAALEGLPNDQELLLSRARLFVAGNQLSAALADYDRAARSGPLPAQEELARVNLTSRLGRRREALQLSEQLLARGVRNAELDYLHSQLVLEVSQDWETAMRSIQRALELEPDHFRARFQRGVLWESGGRPEEAEADLTWALEHQELERQPPQARALALALRGRARRSMGNLDTAIEDLQQAVLLDPALEDAQTELAELQEELEGRGGVGPQ